MNVLYGHFLINSLEWMHEKKKTFVWVWIEYDKSKQNITMINKSIINLGNLILFLGFINRIYNIWIKSHGSLERNIFSVNMS